jgi:hypothetical protein
MRLNLLKEQWIDPDVLVKPDIKPYVENRSLWNPELRLEIKRHGSRIRGSDPLAHDLQQITYASQV